MRTWPAMKREYYKNWTLIAVVRDPLDRFVSGFTNRCIFDGFTRIYFLITQKIFGNKNEILGESKGMYVMDVRLILNALSKNCTTEWFNKYKTKYF